MECRVDLALTIFMLPVQPITPAAALQAGLPPAAAYQASSLVVRLSIKIFNCTPAELPQGLRDQLCGWLCATPAGAEGYIRPGCLHLTVLVPLSLSADSRLENATLCCLRSNPAPNACIDPA